MFLSEKYTTNEETIAFWTDLSYCQDAVNVEEKYWSHNDQSEWEQETLLHLQRREHPAALVPFWYHAEFIAGGKEMNIAGGKEMNLNGLWQERESEGILRSWINVIIVFHP